MIVVVSQMDAYSFLINQESFSKEVLFDLSLNNDSEVSKTSFNRALEEVGKQVVKEMSYESSWFS